MDQREMNTRGAVSEKEARNVLIRTILTLFNPLDTLQFQPCTEETERAYKTKTRNKRSILTNYAYYFSIYVTVIDT
jgi:hypothetical protein